MLLTANPATLLTLAIEVAVVSAWRWAQPVPFRAVSWPHWLGLCVLANLLTHPLAWRLAVLLVPADYRAGFWLIELGVWLVETGAYWTVWRSRVGLLRAAAVSLLANLVSMLAGFVLAT
ncbi:hypothetical protein [Chitinilyticum piscinae]|uniref:Uncharacterized protein n=1 Tax=Chitinilyticum piscinae TaxID=2866724 RepID=A0A8J7FQJ2_9NEIS|nr:hypothetical protein [Chitinilyticum piscinae]MBE9608871.1 hypothetical protein [Chitinilyticum piscinae]